MTDEDIVREPGEMTPDEQLAEWVKGNSIHNNNRWYSVVDDDGKVVERRKMEGGECCPDFSCCMPSLQWTEDARRVFADADEKTRMSMLFNGLGMLINTQQTSDSGGVYLAGSIALDNETKH